jgi:hypothetical protein
MYIPLAFNSSGGGGVIPSCNCNTLGFQINITSGQFVDLSYQPCNGEIIQTIRYTSDVPYNETICIADRNYSFSGTGLVSGVNLNKVCLEENCQSCSCYEYFYRISVDGPTYIRYVPCNEPSSSAVTIGPFAPLSTGSFVCSFPWTVMPISGGLDFPPNGPTGVIKQVNSGSCQPIVSGSLQVGDLRGGGMVIYVTGSYPNQSGLIMTTESVATSSADMSRWGFYGTVTGITNQAYGTGASNTAALRNYTPATGSIAANALTASINGYDDWFLPSVTESVRAVRNHITWPVQWATISGVQSNYLLSTQPQLWVNTSGSAVLTSNEFNTPGDIFLGSREQSAWTVQATYVAVDPSAPDDRIVLTNRFKNVPGKFFGYRYFNSSLIP